MNKIFLLLCFNLCFHLAHAQPFNANLAFKLQHTLDSLVNIFSPNTKGISASAYCPGQGIWKGASGISYAGHPVTTDMEFGLASNTKLLTAVTLLKLVESNIISLDNPLSNWIPNYNNVNPNITIRQLLNHTSGVSDPFFTTALLDSISAHPTHVYTPQEVLTWLGPPTFAPGGGYGYSNINYILAGLVAESAAGIPMPQLIRNNLLTPLQLNYTFYDIQEPVIGTLAHRWHNLVDFNDTSRIALNTSGGPAGAMFSTSGDMAGWYHALMSGQVINASSLAEMTTFGTSNYGLGLKKITFFGKITWGHDGSTFGYSSRVIYDPCMQTVVCCLSNSDQSAVDGITALMYKVLIDNLPACAGTITGLTSVCQGQNSVTYSVPAILQATSYVWSLPNGASGTSSTNSITVNYGLSAISGNVTVKGLNSYGEGALAALAITVKIKPATPVITFNANILHSNAPAGNQWYNQGGAINNAVNQDYTISASGNYYTVVTLLGCSSDPSNVINAVLVPLGVRLIFFTGEIEHNYNLLKWATASETNNQYFEIERSEDAIRFETTGQVQGVGNSISTQIYQYKDENRHTGLLYYRLKQVDQDGKFAYSNTIALNNTSETSIYIYPNPVTNNLYVHGLLGDNSRYQIINPAGQVLLEGVITPNQPVSIAPWSAGVYFLKIKSLSLKFKKE